ncbi:late competence development ComFB family protein [Ectobacillus ponti]|uniref:Late competence development ComFB family protein n=1 Tax=Ectobacillus ponti TaxID=2961894 RepID=A0AA41XAD4_9BACI|nr:late competence development ComFB family protein [Ectobacillus ponti]MCP8968386.1 late competence development ComFB family protein [Ectobacillus ponti]
MAVQNVMEIIVEQVLKEFSRSHKLHCECEECREDILALALNHLPSKYASTHEGEAIVKALYTDISLRQTVIKEVMFAAVKVEQHPKCGKAAAVTG